MGETVLAHDQLVAADPPPLPYYATTTVAALVSSFRIDWNTRRPPAESNGKAATSDVTMVGALSYIAGEVERLVAAGILPPDSRVSEDTLGKLVKPSCPLPPELPYDVVAGIVEALDCPHAFYDGTLREIPAEVVAAQREAKQRVRTAARKTSSPALRQITVRYGVR